MNRLDYFNTQEVDDHDQTLKSNGVLRAGVNSSNVNDDSGNQKIVDQLTGLVKTLGSSLMETIMFYADSGDLLSAAHMALIFYDEVLCEQQ